MLVLVTINIQCNTITDTLRMCHLTKYTAIRTCNTFDCCIRTIWIKVLIHSRISLQIHVSCSNLTICEKRLDHFFACNKTSFTMRSRNSIYPT